MIRPILVTLDKADVTGALADGTFSSVVSLNIGHMMQGSTLDYRVEQIAVISEDSPTTWAVAFWNDSGGPDASDLDSDALAHIESVTKNTTAAGGLTNDYYSNSDLKISIKATPTGSQDTSAHAANQKKMQMHVSIAPVGAAKTSGATGEVVVKFWVVPILGVLS